MWAGQLARAQGLTRPPRPHPHREKQAFEFDPDLPSLAELHDVAAMQPTSVATAAAVIEAYQQWIEARIARYGPMIKPSRNAMWELRWLK